MKFQKTLVAVAIAGIAAVPMIASADTTLSGVVQIQVTGTDADDDSGDARIAADDVLFGIATEHELNSGLTGYGSLRVDINRLSNQDNGTQDPFNTPENDDDDIDLGSTLGTADSVYVGVKGGFGDLRFGEVANGVEVGQVANDIYDVTSDTNGGIGYTGSFGPVGLKINYSPEAQNNEDVIGAGVSFGLGGFSIGLGAEDRADIEAVAVGASFTFAGASVAAHFWSRDDAPETESVSVKVGYGFAGISADLTVSQQEGTDIDDSAVRLDLVYDLGGGFDISSRITAASDNNNSSNDLTSYRVKLSKAF